MREDIVRVPTRYTPEFRSDAVRLIERTGRSLRRVASDLGISPAALVRWRREEMAKRRAKQEPGPAVPPASETLEEENARLKRELAKSQRKIDQLEMDREILKKAAAFFAKESE